MDGREFENKLTILNRSQFKKDVETYSISQQNVLGAKYTTKNTKTFICSYMELNNLKL